MAIVIAAAATTVGAVFVLASAAGWTRVMRLTEANHPWVWLLVCLAGELVAYAGYMLTIRDMARVDDCSEMSLSASAQTVLAGFGVFAATRSSGGFAVDYWAFQKAGANKSEAAARAVGLGLLEYVVLSIGALIASAALFFRLDGHAGNSTTLPSLLILPCLGFGLYLTSPRRARRLGKAQGGRGRRWFAALIRGATTVRTLLLSPREHGVGVAGNAAYWAGDILCLWAALQVVEVRLSVAALVLAYSGGYVLTRRALPAGGAGVVEVALTLAIFWMGAPFARTLLAVVIYRLFNFWLPILPALVLMPSIKRLRQRFQQGEQVA
ncbi:MAG TPA: lysylphosphatidylglycerol synthase transmembrane domain-containing protein [Gaiellaceae bacterium]|nr:lysylphosphatidylglycerol synthase transmembrane domain-containing protein [Gaiellaceae bacterium]